MILYHGSNQGVQEPHLLKIQRDLDFGKGFYTTSDFDQAVSWAYRTARIRGTGAPAVSCYEISDAGLNCLKTLRFKTADQDWLDFISANRKGIAPQNDWDLIIGDRSRMIRHIRQFCFIWMVFLMLKVQSKGS